MTDKVVVLDVDAGFSDLTGLDTFTAARILIRRNEHPLGWILLPVEAGKIGADSIKTAVTRQLGWAFATDLLVSEQVWARGNPFYPPVTVIICTRNRASLLSGCLEALRLLDYPQFEILVVDNAPSDNSTAEVVKEARATYLREPIAGLDRARNAGALKASHEIIAYVDDDARPDPAWLKHLVRPFQRADVAIVTGLVIPAELETPAQVFFEVYGGMGHGLRTRSFYREELTLRERIWASACGVGTNMALRKHILVNLGMFDPALDVGTPSAGGGDVEIFHRAIAAGHRLVYTPSAIVSHIHRRTLQELRCQLRNNGRSFGCYLITSHRRGSLSSKAVAYFLVFEWGIDWILKRLIRPQGVPRQMVLAELWGMLSSPLAYLGSRKSAALIRETGHSGSDVDR
jgi:glycosyltransferase involved in cell wall biosynthesis